MDDLVLVKLGGSLITDKGRQETPRLGEIERLSREIHSARKAGDFGLIVGHGGGSFPHRPASRYRTAEGFFGPQSAKGMALVQDSAARLNRIVVRALIDAGENAFPFQPSACMVTKNGEIEKAFLDSMNMALEKGLLPVPYGDVVFDESNGCGILSTEKILDFMAKGMRASRIVIAGNEDGVWEDFPRKAKLISEINGRNFASVRKSLGSSAGVDVTGGMLHKVERMLQSAKETKTPSLIINGTIPGRLRDAILGRTVVGTIIRA